MTEHATRMKTWILVHQIVVHLNRKVTAGTEYLNKALENTKTIVQLTAESQVFAETKYVKKENHKDVQETVILAVMEHADHMKLIVM